MKPYNLSFGFTILFIFACDNKTNKLQKLLIINTCIWQEMNRWILQIKFVWQSKYDAAPNQKSYLGHQNMQLF
jgi:hypothetical protein